MATPIKVPAIVQRVVRHTDSVSTLFLRPLKACPRFRPGQFLHLAIDPYDPSFQWPESRVFSIATSPTRRESIRITFAVKGAFTARMFDQLCEGREVWLKLPYGSFTLPEDETPVVLVAGGTGITPFLSYLEYAVDHRLTNKIELHYGVRAPEFFLGIETLREAAEALSAFTAYYYTEDGRSPDTVTVAGAGLIPIRDVVRAAQPGTKPLYYLAGPPEMISSFRQFLRDEGVVEKHIMVDDWQ